MKHYKGTLWLSLCAAVSPLLPMVIEARIGYTREQCLEKYGPEIKKENIDNRIYFDHKLGKILIRVMFYELEDEVAQICYFNINDEDPSLTEAEALELLNRNLPKRKWKREVIGKDVCWTNEEGWVATLSQEKKRFLVEFVA